MKEVKWMTCSKYYIVSSRREGGLIGRAILNGQLNIPTRVLLRSEEYSNQCDASLFF